MDQRETNSLIVNVMVGILKHMTRHTGKINSATIVTENVTHLLVVPTTRRKRTMATTSPSSVNKFNQF